MQATAEISVARVYELRGADAQPGTACRVLVDRLWPRGLRREDVPLMCWVKDVAPSPELRKWYSHEVELWDEFVVRYREELEAGEAAEAVEQLAEHAADRGLVLLTATKDVEHSSARILRDLLVDRIELSRA